jgi:hypothetical protein
VYGSPASADYAVPHARPPRVVIHVRSHGQHRHTRLIPQAGPVGFDAPDAFLLSKCAPQESMGLFNLDGFLTSIFVSPKLILPSEWLPVVWGGEEPALSASRGRARSSGPS